MSNVPRVKCDFCGKEVGADEVTWHRMTVELRTEPGGRPDYVAVDVCERCSDTVTAADVKAQARNIEFAPSSYEEPIPFRCRTCVRAHGEPECLPRADGKGCADWQPRKDA